VVEEKEVHACSLIFELLKVIPGLRYKIEKVPFCPFPLMTYSPDAAIIEELLSQVRAHGERMVELCRFAISHSYRSLRLAKHIFESTIAFYWFYLQFDHAIACCDSSKKAFYRRYGVRQLAGTKEGDLFGIGVSSSCIFGSAKSVPSPAKESLVRMAEVYSETGRICCFPFDSSQFYDPIHQPRTEAQVALATR